VHQSLSLGTFNKKMQKDGLYELHGSFFFFTFICLTLNLSLLAEMSWATTNFNSVL
jgi:hypothetical protein